MSVDASSQLTGMTLNFTVPSLSQAKMTQGRTGARKSQGAINGNPQTQKQNPEQQPNQEQPAKC